MNIFYRHLVAVTLLVGLWLPLQWLVLGLDRSYAPHIPVWQISAWELALLAMAVAVPVWLMRRLRLIESKDHGDQLMQ